MNTINNSLQKVLKWDIKEFLKAIIGCFLFALAVNIFIVPNALYNGGILGIAQLIRSILETAFNLKFSFDISGIINFAINIPLFIIAYKMISETFFKRTLVCVIFQTIFLTLIPTPAASLIEDILTCVIIGGIVAGVGSGMTLSASGSGGGTDIIGLVISMHNKKTSVGKIGGAINVVIYVICGILYGIPTMIYSIIYAVILSLVVDHTHEQNICSYVMIFTKKQPTKIIKFIREELERDTTYWEGYGGYQKSKTYISYCALSKYEMQRLERHIPELDPNAFMIKSEGIGIEGNFTKYLTK
ncbi:MAG: YitT family protein [Bacilli bacterium]|nr:YitT family protein [Bacilli bacterium]